jgi:hypothetical protein
MDKSSIEAETALLNDDTVCESLLRVSDLIMVSKVGRASTMDFVKKKSACASEMFLSLEQKRFWSNQEGASIFWFIFANSTAQSDQQNACSNSSLERKLRSSCSI